jgi:hypothetical protein
LWKFRLKKKKSEKLTELGRCMLRDGDDKLSSTVMALVEENGNHRSRSFKA